MSGSNGCNVRGNVDVVARSFPSELLFQQKFPDACESIRARCRGLVKWSCREHCVLQGSKNQERREVQESSPSAGTPSMPASIPYQQMLDSNTNVHRWPRTFIRAFKSLPVHCLKSLPCGKRRSLGNEGTIAILFLYSESGGLRRCFKYNLPAVNVVHYFFRTLWSVLLGKIYTNPRHQMVFEYPFYDLVEDIGQHHFIDVSTRKEFRKGLPK